MAVNRPALLGARQQLRDVLIEERDLLDRLIAQTGDPNVPAARLVDLVEALESLDRRVESLIARLREESSEVRRQQEERSVRQFVLRALEGIGSPQNAGFLQEYMWARERVDLDTRGFGALRRDERRSWQRRPGRRLAYIVPALSAEGTALPRLMARSDWPLERRLVLDDDQRLIDLAKLRALFAARRELEAGDLPDAFEVLIEKYARELFSEELEPPGDRAKRETWLARVARRAEAEAARLERTSAAQRDKAAAKLRRLPEGQQLWGTDAM